MGQPAAAVDGVEGVTLRPLSGDIGDGGECRDGRSVVVLERRAPDQLAAALKDQRKLARANLIVANSRARARRRAIAAAAKFFFAILGREVEALCC